MFKIIQCVMINSIYLTSWGAFLLMDSPTFVYFAEITGTVSPLALAKFAGTRSSTEPSLDFEATGVTEEAILVIVPPGRPKFDWLVFQAGEKLICMNSFSDQKIFAIKKERYIPIWLFSGVYGLLCADYYE